MNDLKAKLPFGKAKDAELEESENFEEENSSEGQTDQTDITDVDLEEEEERLDENASFTDKLKAKLKQLQKKTNKGAKETGPKIAANNNRRTLIIGVILVGLGVILFGEDFIPSSEPEPQVATSFKRPVRNKPVNPQPPTEVAPVETLPTETPVEVADAPSTDTQETVETAPDSPVDVTSVESDPSETTIQEDPLEATPAETTIVETPTFEAGETVTDIPPTSIDTIDGETAPSEDNLTDQILQDLEKQARDTQKPGPKTEYVNPPDYEFVGRGLVYNCAGKHWACVDAPSYKTCEDNASSTQYLKKTTECHPFNIYETQKGCEAIQNRMVSSSAKTEFCN